MVPFAFQNRLLSSLTPDDLARLAPFEPFELVRRETLEHPYTPIEHVYFVEDGVVSIVARTKANREIEVGVVGPEGMTATALLHGDDQSPFETFVQVEGRALRVEAARLKRALELDTPMRAVFQRYGRALDLQIAATSISNGRSKLEERLARWLLMVDDRTAGRTFEITHELLSIMLSVRRSGVTLALQLLEGRGLIRANRGRITVLNRQGLIEATNGAYGLAEREYARLMEAA